VQLSEVVSGQTLQTPPLAPQAETVTGLVHTFPEQQPAHEVESHRHIPPEQRWPAAQAALAPQVHEPFAAQVSVLVRSQVVQAEPALPQVVGLREVHAPPAQQPLGQLVALQAPPVQLPLVQVCPTAQAGLVPQRHAPVAQLSALVTSHEEHDAPLVPQAPIAAVMQTPAAEQQPVGQVVASQTQPVPTQRWPTAHAGPELHAQPLAVQLLASSASHCAHAAPGAPQVVSVRAVQTFPAQQPLGHDAAVQAQIPPEQAWPAAHSAPVPHAQLPVLEHPSARIGSHPKQVDPLVPHAVTVVGWVQTFPVQQPFAQDVASHSHCPLMQRRPAPHAAAAPHLQVPSLAQLFEVIV
jgi:hypothetical protein